MFAASLVLQVLTGRMDKLRAVPNPDTLAGADDRPRRLLLVSVLPGARRPVRQETICAEKRPAYPRKII